MCRVGDQASASAAKTSSHIRIEEALVANLVSTSEHIMSRQPSHRSSCLQNRNVIWHQMRGHRGGEMIAPDIDPASPMVATAVQPWASNLSYSLSRSLCSTRVTWVNGASCLLDMVLSSSRRPESSSQQSSPTRCVNAASAGSQPVSITNYSQDSKFDYIM